jgi:hypothetical protein
MRLLRLGLLAIVLLSSALVPCLADTLGLAPPTAFDWEVKLDKTPLKGPMVLAARSQEEWAAFWKQQDPQREALPRVDFALNMVVGIVSDKEFLIIYRVELDDAANPKELLVRATSEEAICFGQLRAPAKGTRLHLVAVPRSALPIRFVMEGMVDGDVYELHPEGVRRANLGIIAGVAKPDGSGKAVYREQAEKLVRDRLTAEEIKAARAKVHPPSLGHRYPEPSSKIDVRRQEKSWAITYDGMSFRVDVASGEVVRLKDLPTKEK